jgi:preprotein translocase subunit SecF
LAPIERDDLASVSPVVARETVRNAAVAVVAAALVILLYITWAFRRVPNPFRMGATAVIALIHDVLVTLGVFAILSKFMALEVNAMFITGVLTVVGYSVHDTIVVFDRIRENTARRTGRSLEATINVSLWETMGRSLNTSITTMLVIAALLLLGGPTLRSLLLTLLIGIVTGTYSSIGIAAQLLVVWQRGEWLRPLRRRPRPAAA